MGDKNFLSAEVQIRDEPAKDRCRRETTESLSEYKPRDIDRPNACERITEASRDRDRRIGK